MRHTSGNIHRKVASAFHSRIHAPQSGRQANRGGKRKRKRNTVRVSIQLPYHPGFLEENEEEMVLCKIRKGSISFGNGH